MSEQKICMSSLVVSKCEMREEKVEGESLVHGRRRRKVHGVSSRGNIRNKATGAIIPLSPSGARSTEFMQDETDNTPNSAVCPTPSS